MAPTNLVRSFRDTPNLANDAWRDRRISCRLEPDDYDVIGHEVHWFVQLRHPPAIVFACDATPIDKSRAIVVTGVCRGMIRDGKDRGANVDFVIRCTDCTVTALPP